LSVLNLVSDFVKCNHPMHYLMLQRDGFFIECGALNGEKGSNSLWLEKDLGWRGLLAEGDQKSVPIIK
jgi:hypothetical protein